MVHSLSDLPLVMAFANTLGSLGFLGGRLRLHPLSSSLAACP
jgi:hypothetical protein